MIKSDKKLRELADLLDKNNDLSISEAVEMLREEQPFEGVIGLLSSYYDRAEDHLAKKAIENFLNDIKDQSVRPEVIDEIRKEWKPSTLSMLVSSCWQSGLDYSGYPEVFATVFMNSDYFTAIECLTVFQESVHSISKEKKDEIISLLKETPFRHDDPRISLGDELIALLSE